VELRLCEDGTLTFFLSRVPV